MKQPIKTNQFVAELNRPVRQIPGLKRLLDTQQLALELNRPIRQIRSLVQARKIPVIKLGWRTNLFDVDKVLKALSKFEIPAVGDKK